MERLTLAGTRSITKSEVSSLTSQIKNATPSKLPEILRNSVARYDELYARFGNTPADELDADRILKFLKDDAIKVDVIDAKSLA
jgi:hypothetical protein